MVDTDAIRARMKDCGYTIRSFSKALNYSVETVSGKLCGRVGFSLNNVMAIKNLLHLTREQTWEIFFKEQT